MHFDIFHMDFKNKLKRNFFYNSLLFCILGPFVCIPIFGDFARLHILFIFCPLLVSLIFSVLRYNLFTKEFEKYTEVVIGEVTNIVNNMPIFQYTYDISYENTFFKELKRTHIGQNKKLLLNPDDPNDFILYLKSAKVINSLLSIIECLSFTFSLICFSCLLVQPVLHMFCSFVSSFF